jgi:hypothetical protein
MEITAGRLRNLFLLCGILAPLLFIGTDLLAGMLYDNYNFITQSISELSAYEAPTRPLIVPLNFAYNILIIAFAFGIWGSGVKSRAQLIMTGLLVGNAIVALLATFFPMHLSEDMSTPANTMNVIILGVSLVLLLLSILFGAFAYKNWFRLYSIGTLLTFIMLTIFGLFQTTSHVGAQERTITYGCLLWVAVQALVLLRTGKPPASC